MWDRGHCIFFSLLSLKIILVHYFIFFNRNYIVNLLKNSIIFFITASLIKQFKKLLVKYLSYKNYFSNSKYSNCNNNLLYVK